MVQQRPLPQARLRPRDKVVSAYEQTPQVSVLIERSILDNMPPDVKEFMTQFLGSFIFIDFCKMQLEKAEASIVNLRENVNTTPEQDFQLYKDMRLVCRFWTDLLRYAEEFKSRPADQL